MAVTNLDRRASKLEDSMESLRQQKEAEERKAWREENSERLRFEMFLRQYGPGEDNFGWAKRCLEDKERDAEAHADAEAALAQEDMLRRILTHYDEDGVVNFTSMDTNEKAFANLFEELFQVVNDNDLFMRDVEDWEHKLGLDLPSFVDLIKAIDEHTGSSDWRQIRYSEEGQHGLLKAAYTDFENRRARALQYREREKQKESMAQALGT
jgi:hypothetical protein